MEFHMINTQHCTCAHKQKIDIFMQRRLYIDEAHTALDIFRFAVFLFYFLNKNMLMLVPYPFIVKYWVGYSLINCLPCVRPSVIAIASAMVGRCLFIVCSMMAFTTFYTTFSYISLYTRQSSWVRYFIQYILWILSVSATRYK